MRTFTDPAALAAATGEPLGTTDWVRIDQDRVDTFAAATGDHQWIHVDLRRAADGPFGGTIAHGFLTLSLLPELLGSLYTVENLDMGVNYGLDRVRFPAPVPVGARVRLTASVARSRPGDGHVDITFGAVVEIEGGTRPACVAESIARLYG